MSRTDSRVAFREDPHSSSGLRSTPDEHGYMNILNTHVTISC
jgi:hypothetical protein